MLRTGRQNPPEHSTQWPWIRRSSCLVLGKAHYTQPYMSAKFHWRNQRTHLACFPSLRDHCPLLTHAWCLKNHCFLYFSRLFYCCYYSALKGGKSGPCYSILASWLEVGVPQVWLFLQLQNRVQKLRALEIRSSDDNDESNAKLIQTRFIL